MNAMTPAEHFELALLNLDLARKASGFGAEPQYYVGMANAYATLALYRPPVTVELVDFVPPKRPAYNPDLDYGFNPSPTPAEHHEVGGVKDDVTGYRCLDCACGTRIDGHDAAEVREAFDAHLRSDTLTADDYCAPFLATDTGMWSIGGGMCVLRQSWYPSPENAIAFHNRSLAELIPAELNPGEGEPVPAPPAPDGYDGCHPVRAGWPGEWVIGGGKCPVSSTGHATAREAMDAHGAALLARKAEIAELNGEMDHGTFVVDIPAAPVRVSDERVAGQISSETLQAVVEYINRYRDVWALHAATDAHQNMTGPGFLVMCSCGQQLGPYTDITVANSEHQAHAGSPR